MSTAHLLPHLNAHCSTGGRQERERDAEKSAADLSYIIPVALCTTDCDNPEEADEQERFIHIAAPLARRQHRC